MRLEEAKTKYRQLTKEIKENGAKDRELFEQNSALAKQLVSRSRFVWVATYFCIGFSGRDSERHREAVKRKEEARDRSWCAYIARDCCY